MHSAIVDLLIEKDLTTDDEYKKHLKAKAKIKQLDPSNEKRYDRGFKKILHHFFRFLISAQTQ